MSDMTTDIANPPAPSFWQSVKSRFASIAMTFKEAWEWASIYEAHRKAGNANPAAATEMEIYIRGEYFEGFRDLASDAYMKDGTDLADVKKDFIRDRLSTKTTLLDTATTATIRAVIREMGPDEAYHGNVYAKYLADMDRLTKNALAEAERINGPGGYSPLERRVLRGRN